MASQRAMLKNPANYDTCPLCGALKRKAAANCKDCRRHLSNTPPEEINLSGVSDIWLAEFRGLFYGEGSAMIVKNGKASFAPILTIGLRDDDARVIIDIQRVLGGRIFYQTRNNPNHGSVIRWREMNLYRCAQICKLLLQGRIPAKKMNDIRLVLDFCEWRMTTPYNFTDETRQEAERRFNELRESRTYRSC